MIYRDYNDWIMGGAAQQKMHSLKFKKSTMEFYDSDDVTKQRVY